MTSGIHLYTVAAVNHGRIGWRWTVMDWGIPIETGYERKKSGALEKARSIVSQKRKHHEVTKCILAVSAHQPSRSLELLARAA